MTKKVTSTATARIAIPGLFTGTSTFSPLDTVVIPPYAAFNTERSLKGQIATELRAIHAKQIADDRFLFIAASVGQCDAGFVLSQPDGRPSFLIEFIDQQDKVISPDKYDAYPDTIDFTTAVQHHERDPETRLVLVFDGKGVVHRVVPYLPEEILHLNLKKLSAVQATPQVEKAAPKAAYQPTNPVKPYMLYLAQGATLLDQRNPLRRPGFGATQTYPSDMYLQKLIQHFGPMIPPQLADIYRAMGTNGIKLGYTERQGAFAEMLFRPLDGVCLIGHLLSVYCEPGAFVSYSEARQRGLLTAEDVESIDALEALVGQCCCFQVRFDAQFRVLSIEAVQARYEFGKALNGEKQFSVLPSTWPSYAHGSDPYNQTPWVPGGFGGGNHARHEGIPLNPMFNPKGFDLTGHVTAPRGAMFTSQQPKEVPGSWPTQEDRRGKFREIFDALFDMREGASEKDREEIFEQMLKTFRPDVAMVKPDPFRAFFDKVVLFARAMSVSPLAKDELFGEFCQLISSQRKLIPLEQFSKLRSTYESVFSQLRECAEPSEVYEALFAELMAAVD